MSDQFETHLRIADRSDHSQVHAVCFFESTGIVVVCCHPVAVLSLPLTTRTSSSIWNGFRRVGSFSSFAHHSINTRSGLDFSRSNSSIIFWMVTSHSSRRIGYVSLCVASHHATYRRSGWDAGHEPTVCHLLWSTSLNHSAAQQAVSLHGPVQPAHQQVL